MKPIWRYSFWRFHLHNPKQKQNHQKASSRAKKISTRSQTCVKYRGIIFINKRNSDVNTGDLKIFFFKCQNKLNFPDIIFNFSKVLCVLPSILCMTRELWPRRFIWHQDIRVWYDMSFIITQYFFCNSFRRPLIRVY